MVQRKVMAKVPPDREHYTPVYSRFSSNGELLPSASFAVSANVEYTQLIFLLGSAQSASQPFVARSFCFGSRRDSAATVVASGPANPPTGSGGRINGGSGRPTPPFRPSRRMTGDSGGLGLGAKCVEHAWRGVCPILAHSTNIS